MITRLRRMLLTTCAAVAMVSPALGADGEAAGPIALRRADLAAAYLRFDHLFARTPVAGDALIAINERFDDLTGLFFRGDARGAILALADLSADLNGGDPEDRLFASVVVDVGSRVLDPCADDELAITLRALVGADAAAPATVTLRTRAGERIVSAPVTIDDGGARIALPLGDLPEGGADYDLTLERDGAPPMLLARLAGACGSLDAQREHNERLLGAIARTPAIAQALAAARSRNDLLTDTPPVGESTTLVAGLGTIGASMPGEIELLQQGQSPYAHRAGHYWRTIRLGETDIPVRIYAPDDAAQGGAPLVITLHGAGGDENLFPDGYGAGLITRLADERGFIVASPRTEYFLANPAAFETLIGVLRDEYDIDPARVYAVGHSLGAVAITSSGPEIADDLAAAACLAGPVFIAPPPGAPALLLVAAELDPIAPPRRLARYVEMGTRAGISVEYRELAGQGHTLMVNEALPLAIDWLLERRLGPVQAAP